MNSVARRYGMDPAQRGKSSSPEALYPTSAYCEQDLNSCRWHMAQECEASCPPHPRSRRPLHTSGQPRTRLDSCSCRWMRTVNLHYTTGCCMCRCPRSSRPTSIGSTTSTPRAAMSRLGLQGSQTRGASSTPACPRRGHCCWCRLLAATVAVTKVERVERVAAAKEVVVTAVELEAAVVVSMESQSTETPMEGQMILLHRRGRKGILHAASRRTRRSLERR